MMKKKNIVVTIEQNNKVLFQGSFSELPITIGKKKTNDIFFTNISWLKSEHLVIDEDVKVNQLYIKNSSKLKDFFKNRSLHSKEYFTQTIDFSIEDIVIKIRDKSVRSTENDKNSIEVPQGKKETDVAIEMEAETSTLIQAPQEISEPFLQTTPQASPLDEVELEMVADEEPQLSNYIQQHSPATSEGEEFLKEKRRQLAQLIDSQLETSPGVKVQKKNNPDSQKNEKANKAKPSPNKGQKRSSTRSFNPAFNRIKVQEDSSSNFSALAPIALVVCALGLFGYYFSKRNLPSKIQSQVNRRGKTQPIHSKSQRKKVKTAVKKVPSPLDHKKKGSSQLSSHLGTRDEQVALVQKTPVQKKEIQTRTVKDQVQVKLQQPERKAPRVEQQNRPGSVTSPVNNQVRGVVKAAQPQEVADKTTFESQRRPLVQPSSEVVKKGDGPATKVKDESRTIAKESPSLSQPIIEDKPGVSPQSIEVKNAKSFLQNLENSVKSKENIKPTREDDDFVETSKVQQSKEDLYTEPVKTKSKISLEPVYKEPPGSRLILSSAVKILLKSGLKKKTINRAILKESKSIKKCFIYLPELSTKPTLMVAYNVELSEEGEISSFESYNERTQLNQCVRKAMDFVIFPISHRKTFFRLRFKIVKK